MTLLGKSLTKKFFFFFCMYTYKLFNLFDIKEASSVAAMVVQKLLYVAKSNPKCDVLECFELPC